MIQKNIENYRKIQKIYKFRNIQNDLETYRIIQNNIYHYIELYRAIKNDTNSDTNSGGKSFA